MLGEMLKRRYFCVLPFGFILIYGQSRSIFHSNINLRLNLLLIFFMVLSYLEKICFGLLCKIMKYVCTHRKDKWDRKWGGGGRRFRLHSFYYYTLKRSNVFRKARLFFSSVDLINSSAQPDDDISRDPKRI